MNHTYKLLKSVIELFTAVLSQVKVYVVESLGENLIIGYRLWRIYRKVFT